MRKINWIPIILSSFLCILFFIINMITIVIIKKNADNDTSDAALNNSSEIVESYEEPINLEYIGKSKGVYEYVDLVTGKHYLITDQGGICER